MNERLACRQLLRHLNNATVLRKNPLLRPLLFAPEHTVSGRSSAREVVEVARAALHAAAETIREAPGKQSELVHRERQYQILLRCDLAGESHTDVAAALGIGRRQFYRERNRACDLLVEYFIERFHKIQLPPEAQQHTDHARARVVDIFALELSRANALRQTAQFDTAATQFERIATSQCSALQQTLAGCGLAELFADIQSFTKAQRLLDRTLAHVTSQAEMSEGERHVALAETHVTRARLAEAQGESGSIDALCALASHHARAALLAGAHNAHTVLARVALLQVSHNDLRGDNGAAARNLSHARDAIAETPYPTANIVGEYFRRALDHQVNNGAAQAGITETYSRALDVAERNGLVVEASRIISTYAAYLSLVDRVADARIYLRECLAMDALTPTHAYTDLLLAAANIECAPNGDAARAIDLARQAEPRLEPGSLNWANAKLMRSMAYLSLGDHSEVIEPISQAIHSFQKLESPRYAGTAMGILAGAYDGLGRKKEAHELIRDAIDQLQRHGNARQLSQAYSTSARITGSRRHAREAHKLLRAT